MDTPERKGDIRQDGARAGSVRAAAAIVGMTMRACCFALVAGIAILAPARAAEPLPGEIFGWKDCVSSALAQHPDLVSAREKVKQAKATEGITRSTMLPQIDASMDMSRSKQETSTVLQRGEDIRRYTYGVKGKQLFFDGGKAYFDTVGESKLVQQTIYDGLAVSSTIRFNLRNAFVDLLKAQESINIVKQIVDRRSMSLELVRMRYAAGREHRGSLLTAEVNLAQAEAEYSQVLRSISVARHRLIREMGMREWKELSVSEKLAVPTVSTARPDFIALANSTPLVKKAEMQREYAEYKLKSSQAEYAPQMYGTANAGKTDTAWPPQDTQWSVGVEVTLPLVQGGKRVYQNSRDAAQYRQAVADLNSSSSDTAVTLEQKWIGLMNAIDTFRVKEKGLKAAEERARIAAAQYSIGQILFDNWIIIENDLVQAKKDHLNSWAGILFAEAQWNNSLGVTLENDR